MEKQRISTFLDKRQIDALKSLSGVTRIKMADYIREGIDMVLSKYRKDLKKTKRKGGE